MGVREDRRAERRWVRPRIRFLGDLPKKFRSTDPMLTRLASFQVALDWTFLENGDPTGSASSDVAILAWLTPMAAYCHVVAVPHNQVTV